MPVSYQIPNWLQPADPASAYLRSVQVGAGIAEAQQRNQQEQQRMAQQAQLERERLASENARQMVQLAVSKAYHEANLQLQQSRLKDAKDANALRTLDAQERLKETARHNAAMEEKGGKEAALKFAAQQGYVDSYNKYRKQGMPDDQARQQALLDNPALLTPTTIGSPRGAKGPTFNELLNAPEKLQALNSAIEGDPNNPVLLATRGLIQNSITNAPGLNIPKRMPVVHHNMPLPISGGVPVSVPPSDSVISPKEQPAPAFSEGQRIRNKKTGQMYVVQNGVPVPMQDQSDQKAIVDDREPSPDDNKPSDEEE